MTAAPLPSGIQGLVFDLDGTLVDSYGAIGESLNHARRSFGHAPLSDAEVRQAVGHGLESLIADSLGEEHVAEGVRLFRERYAEVYAGATHLLPGVADGLAALGERGLPMTVASNKPARFGRAIVESLEIAHHFVDVLGPDVVGTTKPEPTMIRRCLELMAVAPEQALYVGDMVLDVESGRRAGVHVALVEGGSAGRDQLLQTGLPVFSSLTGLLAALAAAG